jgi:ABC-type Fe3+-hydroxamate transport system substrate-binding protein
VITFPTRHVRRAALALGFALALTACGDDTDGSAAVQPDEPAGTTAPAGAAATTTEAATATAAAAGATRTVEDAFGPVELPAAYERPVPLDGVFAADMLQLGVQPAAIPNDVKLQLSTLLEWLPAGTDLEAFPDFGESYPLNLEALARVAPDLLIAANWELDYYGDSLGQIAPVYSAEWEHNGAWRDRFLRVADALDRSDEAQAVSDEFDAFVAQLPPELTGQTIAFVRASALDDIRADILPTSFAGSVAAEAGIPLLDLSSEIDIDPDANWIDLSQETLELLAGADLIVISDLSFYDPEVEPTDVVLAGNPLWNGLPAVQNDRVVMVPGPVYNGGSYQAATALLTAIATTVTGG